MFDLIIRGDRVVTPEGSGKWDICIQGETIAAVAAPGTFDDSQAARVIDTGGKIVIPGGIDPHIHSLWYIPAIEEGGEISMTDGPDVVSRAAIHGGTTTLLDFANCTSSDRRIRAARDLSDLTFRSPASPHSVSRAWQRTVLSITVA